jgi:hypothetical protein
MADAAGLRARTPHVLERDLFEAFEGVGVSGHASGDDQHSGFFGQVSVRATLDGLVDTARKQGSRGVPG